MRRAITEDVIACFYCQVRRATTVDHQQPVVLGGGDVGNLVPACGPCNYSRGAKLGGALKRARSRERRSLLRPWPDQP